MTPLIFASAMALFRATLSSDDPLFPVDGTAGGPVPVNGVWAAVPASCDTPTSLDLSTWPKCATPVGFLDGVVAALEKPGPGKKAAPDQFYSIARTKFWVAKGSPAIVQVDVPIMFSSSTIYIAITPDAVDGAGGFIAATGWPVGCPPTPVAGVTPSGSRCTASTADGVRAAAAMTPDPAKTYRLVRITADAAPMPTAPAQAAPQSAAPDASTVPPPSAPEAVSASPTTPRSTPPTAAPGEVMETPLPPPSGAAPAPQSGSGPGVS
jgi:hypothetical protein